MKFLQYIQTYSDSEGCLRKVYLYMYMHASDPRPWLCVCVVSVREREVYCTGGDVMSECENKLSINQ